jgi:circadian clock protein KaiC
VLGDHGRPGPGQGLVEGTALAPLRGLALELGEHARAGRLTSLWHPIPEPSLDRIGHDLVESVERSGARRVFVDGLDAVRDASAPERLVPYTAALLQEMRERRATLLASVEARDGTPGHLDPPGAGVSHVVDTVIRLQEARRPGSLIHVMSVPKARGRRHDATLVEYEVTHRAIRILGSFVEDGTRGAARSARRKRRQSVARGSQRKR